MTQNSGSGHTYSVNVGDVDGQLAVGENITQSQAIGTAAGPPTESELAQLRGELAALRKQVEEAGDVDEKTRASAAERVDELGAAVNAEEPKLSTMEYVRNWFADNLPKLAGAVTSIVVNPIVGKLVAVAGDTAVAEWKRRFDLE